MLFTSKDFSFLFEPSSHRRLHPSISGKIFRSDVVLVNIGGHKHLPQARDHSGRPGDVIDWPLQVGEMSRQHLMIDQTCLSLPFFFDFDIWVMAHTNWKFGFVFSSIGRTSRKGASSGRRLE